MHIRSQQFLADHTGNQFTRLPGYQVTRLPDYQITRLPVAGKEAADCTVFS